MLGNRFREISICIFRTDNSNELTKRFRKCSSAANISYSLDRWTQVKASWESTLKSQSVTLMSTRWSPPQPTGRPLTPSKGTTPIGSHILSSFLERSLPGARTRTTCQPTNGLPLIKSIAQTSTRHSGTLEAHKYEMSFLIVLCYPSRRKNLLK